MTIKEYFSVENNEDRSTHGMLLGLAAFILALAVIIPGLAWIIIIAVCIFNVHGFVQSFKGT